MLTFSRFSFDFTQNFDFFRRNGSGKSNLLSALAFVLQAPKGLRAQELFHESSKHPQHHVTVEVISDDCSDGLGLTLLQALASG